MPGRLDDCVVPALAISVKLEAGIDQAFSEAESLRCASCGFAVRNLKKFVNSKPSYQNSKMGFLKIIECQKFTDQKIHDIGHNNSAIKVYQSV